MDEQYWLELIPFYVAGTLPEEERQAVEQFIEENEVGQQALNEWQLIAEAVIAEASPKATKLPPIAKRLRDELNTVPDSSHSEPTQPVPVMPDAGPTVQTAAVNTDPVEHAPGMNTPSHQRGGRISWTLAAAVLAMLGVGVMWILLNLGGADTDVTITEIANLNTPQVTSTVEQAGAAPVEITDTPFVIIVTNTPTPTPIPLATAMPSATLAPTLTPVQPPAVEPQVFPETDGSVQAVPPNAGGGMPEVSAMRTGPTGATPAIVVTAGTANECIVTNIGSTSITMYQFPGTEFDVVGQLNPSQFARSFTAPQNGWIQVFPGAGYVQTSLVSFDPDVCSGLPLPTPTVEALGGFPTAIPDDNLCRVSSSTGAGLPVFSLPNENGVVVSTLSTGRLLLVDGRSDAGWYRVVQGGNLLGWVQPWDVNTNGACDQVALLAVEPVPPSPTFAPSPTIEIQ